MSISALVAMIALGSAAFGAQPAPVGCRPVEAEVITPGRLAQELRPLAKGHGATVPLLEGNPGVVWDLGDKRTAELYVYITADCTLGLSTYAGGAENSSPDPNDALKSMAEDLRAHAPDWTISIKSGKVITVQKGSASYETDLRALLQTRLDAGTRIELAGEPVQAVFDGWMLFLVSKDAPQALNLSVRSMAYPWAYYDLTPYG